VFDLGYLNSSKLGSLFNLMFLLTPISFALILLGNPANFNPTPSLNNLLILALETFVTLVVLFLGFAREAIMLRSPQIRKKILSPILLKNFEFSAFNLFEALNSFVWFGLTLWNWNTLYYEKLKTDPYLFGGILWLQISLLTGAVLYLVFLNVIAAKYKTNPVKAIVGTTSRNRKKSR